MLAFCLAEYIYKVKFANFITFVYKYCLLTKFVKSLISKLVQTNRKTSRKVTFLTPSNKYNMLTSFVLNIKAFNLYNYLFSTHLTLCTSVISQIMFHR